MQRQLDILGGRSGRCCIAVAVAVAVAVAAAVILVVLVVVAVDALVGGGCEQWTAQQNYCISTDHRGGGC